MHPTAETAGDFKHYKCRFRTRWDSERSQWAACTVKDNDQAKLCSLSCRAQIGPPQMYLYGSCLTYVYMYMHVHCINSARLCPCVLACARVCVCVCVCVYTWCSPLWFMHHASNLCCPYSTWDVNSVEICQQCPCIIIQLSRMYIVVYFA